MVIELLPLFLALHLMTSSVHGGFCRDFRLYQRINATTKKQTLTSPGYPRHYERGMVCKWLIEAPSKDYVIRVKVKDTRLEASAACLNDYVTVYDGSLRIFRRISTWCGRRGPKFPIVSSRHVILLLFKTNLRKEYRGFSLLFWAKHKGLTITKPADAAITRKILFFVFVLVIGAVMLPFLLAYRNKLRHEASVSTRHNGNVSAVSVDVLKLSGELV